LAYLKPPALTRKIFNPLAMTFGLSGVATLAVKTRKTGDTQRVPVIPAEVDGTTYIVSTRGESEWVRNIRAAGEVTLVNKGASRTYQVTELPVEKRDPIIAAYRLKAGRTVTAYWNDLPNPSDHPVFRLEPR